MLTSEDGGTHKWKWKPWFNVYLGANSKVLWARIPSIVLPKTTTSTRVFSLRLRCERLLDHDHEKMPAHHRRTPRTPPYRTPHGFAARIRNNMNICYNLWIVFPCPEHWFSFAPPSPFTPSSCGVRVRFRFRSSASMLHSRRHRRSGERCTNGHQHQNGSLALAAVLRTKFRSDCDSIAFVRTLPLGFSRWFVLASSR